MFWKNCWLDCDDGDDVVMVGGGDGGAGGGAMMVGLDEIRFVVGLDCVYQYGSIQFQYFNSDLVWFGLDVMIIPSRQLQLKCNANMRMRL